MEAFPWRCTSPTNVTSCYGVGSVGKHGVELAENNGPSSFLPIVAISRVLVQQTPNSKSFLLSYAVPCTLLWVVDWRWNDLIRTSPLSSHGTEAARMLHVDIATRISDCSLSLRCAIASLTFPWSILRSFQDRADRHDSWYHPSHWVEKLGAHCGIG